MQHLGRILDRILFYYLSASLFALVGICFLQVVVRYLFNASFAWAEEISIILMIWSVWAGVCLAMKRGAHLRIQFLVERLGYVMERVRRLVINSLVLVFLVYIVFASRTVLDGLTHMTLLSLPSVPMKVLYYSVPVGSILLFFYIALEMAVDAGSLLSRLKREG